MNPSLPSPPAAVPRLILRTEQQRTYFAARWDGATHAEACQAAGVSDGLAKKWKVRLRVRARCVLGLPEAAPIDLLLVLRLIFDAENLAAIRGRQ